MPTFKDLFKTRKEGPYVPPIKVKICGATREKEYENSNGEEKRYVILGTADTTMAVKCVVYDMSKCRDLEEGRYVMLLNTIIKADKTLTITAKSRVSRIAPFDVPAEIEKEAREIAFPPASPEVPLKEIEKSPLKSLVSVRGQIVAEEITKTVSVKGKDVKVKSITLKDASGKCKVSLWRKFTERDLNIGQHIQIKDVVVQKFINEYSVSTTSRTELETLEAPTEVVVKENIMAYNVEENGLSLTIDDGEVYPSYRISGNMMATFLGCEENDLEAVLLNKLPMTACLTVSNEEIIRISE